MSHPALASPESVQGVPGIRAKDRLLVNKRAAADLLHVSEKTLDKLIIEHALPCVRLGRSVRFSVQALREWIDQKGTN